MFVELPEEFLGYAEVTKRINTDFIESYGIEKSGRGDHGDPQQYLVRIYMKNQTERNNRISNYYWCPEPDKTVHGEEAEFYSEKDSMYLCQGMLLELDRRFLKSHVDKILKG